MNIQWYPGHMAKTRRLISENLKIVDAVAELVDARIPRSSRNPDIDGITGHKPKIIILNKSDMADPAANKRWIDHYKSMGRAAIAVDSISGAGIGGLKTAFESILQEKNRRDTERGMKVRPPRIMVVGIPNVGKSSFINRLSKRAGAKTGDTPGITRDKQWIRISGGYELLDTPGILWPRFDDPTTGLYLAFTGAIKDEVYDVVEAGAHLCSYFAEKYPENIIERYRLGDINNMKGYEILTEIGRKRGCIISGGEVDMGRAARILLDEFRACRLGRITLEMPEDYDE
ncbi:MAG: Ribosome biogenesis GTPase A [Firmicutes bacterium ADurb.Bin193]|nr:MAG: Ribosome biogenesis GTPase A [Firmicutes bacterium ADurb.Bin193]